MAEESNTTESAMQGYFDWQVTTLMLAYDLVEPIKPTDPEAGQARRAAIENEVRELSLAVIPDLFKSDPTLDWPPEVMMDITRATLLRSAQVSGITEA